MLSDNIILFEKREQTIQEKVLSLNLFFEKISPEDKSELFLHYDQKHEISSLFLPVLSHQPEIFRNLSDNLSIIDYYIFYSFLDLLEVIIENGYKLNKEQNNLLFLKLFENKYPVPISEKAKDFFLDYFKHSSYECRESFFLHIINNKNVIHQDYVDFLASNTKDIHLNYYLFSDSIAYNSSLSLFALNKFLEQKDISFANNKFLDSYISMFEYDKNLKEHFKSFENTEIYLNIIIDIYKNLKEKDKIFLFCETSPFIISQLQKYDLSLIIELDKQDTKNTFFKRI